MKVKAEVVVAVILFFIGVIFHEQILGMFG